ncbi:MAG: hypothetical protein IAF58_03280 [Leptolyngbya sp.]|nr:hypothetical protein [Candidatus Melainabacteria bacterium]
MHTLVDTEGRKIPTDKRAITFYADPEIAKWYEALPSSVRSRTINDLLKKIILESEQQSSRALKPGKQDDAIRKLSELVRLLAQEHLSASERESKSKTPETEAANSRLQSALGELDEVDF